MYVASAFAFTAAIIRLANECRAACRVSGSSLAVAHLSRERFQMPPVSNPRTRG